MADVSCDICGEPVRNGDIIYTIASKFDDDGRLVSARHGRCHDSRSEKLRRKAEEALARVRETLGRVRKTLHSRSGQVGVDLPPRRTR